MNSGGLQMDPKFLRNQVNSYRHFFCTSRSMCYAVSDACGHFPVCKVRAGEHGVVYVAALALRLPSNTVCLDCRDMQRGTTSSFPRVGMLEGSVGRGQALAAM